MSGLIECRSLDDIQANLRQRLDDFAVTTGLIVRFSDFNPLEEHHRELLNKIVLTHSQIILDTKKLIKQKEQLIEDHDTAKVILTRLNHLKEQLIHQNGNLPSHLPLPPPTSPTPPVSHPPPTSPSHPCSPPKAKAVHFEVEKKIEEPIIIPRAQMKSKMRKVTTTGSLLKSNGPNKKKRKREVPILVYLTTEEFEDVPKYMRGRLKYTEINDVIKEINDIVSRKYKIMDTPLNKMGGDDMKRFQRYTEMECKETKDFIFFTAEELKDLASTTKTYTLFIKIGSLLRHCGRLRQIRVGKVEKYIVLDAR